MLLSKFWDFKRHDLLTVQMLESLQDSALNAALAPYMTYADGIVNGLDVSMVEGQLQIGPGAVKWQGRLYMMAKPFLLALPAAQQEGYVVLVPCADGLAIELHDAPSDVRLMLAAFKNRDKGSVLEQPTKLECIRFTSFFDTSVLRIADREGQLTWHSNIATCFARELLKKPGATAVDVAFAWQALQAPPTRQMWQLYVEQQGFAWQEELIDMLQRILHSKNKPLQHVVVAAEPRAEQQVQKPRFGTTVD